MVRRVNVNVASSDRLQEPLFKSNDQKMTESMSSSPSNQQKSVEVAVDIEKVLSKIKAAKTKDKPLIVESVPATRASTASSIRRK